jgi:hypothetical protein
MLKFARRMVTAAPDVLRVVATGRVRSLAARSRRADERHILFLLSGSAFGEG